MKVLLVNAVCGSGSTGRIVSDIWSLLKEQGHEAKIAYGVGASLRVAPEDAVYLNGKCDYYIHNVISRFTDRAGFYSTGATRKLIRVIQEFRPDLIHLHNLHGYYLNVELLFEYLANADIPVVWTLHDCWAMTGHCAHFSYVHCSKWIDGCHHCPQLRAYPKCYVFDGSTRNYDDKKRLFTSLKNMIIVTPSEWLADVVRQSYLSRYLVRVVPNGVDLDTFKPIPSDFRDKYQIGNKRIILAVSNVWIEKKGMSDVFELSHILDANEYQVVMVGLTENQLSIVPSNIIAIRRTSNTEELVKIYSAADVFINPSYEETMGLVTAEALACGTPVVTYDRTAVPEVADDSCGVVVEAGNIHALASGIDAALAKDRQLAIKRALKYDKQRIIQEHIDLYISRIKVS